MIAHFLSNKVMNSSNKTFSTCLIGMANGGREGNDRPVLLFGWKELSFLSTISMDRTFIVLIKNVLSFSYSSPPNKLILL